MSAYVIVEVEVLDVELYNQYRPLAQSAVLKYGGRYIVRGGEVTAMEGEWPEGRLIVVLQFESMHRAKQWYHSPEYIQALHPRWNAFKRRLIFVEGISS